MVRSVDVRDALVKTLQLDLVGPGPGHPHEAEQLWEAEPPSRWYLTGFLVPTEAPAHLRFDPESAEVIDAPATDGGGAGDDDVEPDAAPARRVFLPSSIGMSVLVPAGTTTLHAEVLWGDYRKVPAASAAAGADEGATPRRDNAPDVRRAPAPAGPRPPGAPRERKVWQRAQRVESVALTLPKSGLSKETVPGSRGLQLYVSVRQASERAEQLAGLVHGTRVVSVFVVNERDPEVEDRADEANVYQVELRLALEAGFVPRPNLRGREAKDEDERIADVQYHDACELAVGHGIATHAVMEGPVCREVRTCWVPVASVEKVEASKLDLELSMEALAAAATTGAPDVTAHLAKLGPAYAAWIAAQRAAHTEDTRRAEVVGELLDRCDTACRRIEDGIALLAESPRALEAFAIANRAMARAARQRNAQIQGTSPEKVAAPGWRPFQLAFLLMNLRGVVEPAHVDRKVVDLLFFPTGGGKTEAYLGLAAFTLVLRRLADPKITSAGLSVLMRYTLRLLTLDQLGRAAGLVCALELERQKDVEKLGKWPFEIGLWVGRKATPNRMGKKGDPDPDTARARTIAFKNNSREKPSPIPIENCPWCGTKFEARSFTLVPSDDHPTDLRIVCANARCDFTRDNALPIVAVDEPLYRRLPCFVIATVDKLASLPWRAETGKLFGKVERCDAAGFYGPGEAPRGTHLAAGLPPPDLIIQDELHLISGPLGTMVGLFETAVEGLCARTVNGERVLPKIVASTATVRRAEAQVRALFGRTQVDVFPPPGPDRKDSFFARVVPERDKARTYVGIAAQGRSLKVVLLRAYLALLSAGKRWYEAGGTSGEPNGADPYMTLVGYFNALRELGGSRRIVEDEVRGRLHGYGRRCRVGETAGDFANRSIQFDAMELTSRVRTNDVSEAKRRLGLAFHEDKHVDVALATNMISVGLDISRLGLMVVLGQPKTTAEYIQATSRVGRDEKAPGLVVTLLNVHKPRDRSHYERFEAYHATFYRSVEASSVTPFAPRAVDRGLAAVTVALARHGEPSLSRPACAGELPHHRAKVAWLRGEVRRRAEGHRKDLTLAEQEEIGAGIERRVDDLLDAWERIAEEAAQKGGLQYGLEVPARPPLLHTPLDPDLKKEPAHSLLRKFKAQWSLRDVEAEVPVLVKRLDGGTV